MPRLLLTGARQRPPQILGRRDEWHMYEEALLVELDTASGELATRLRWRSPPEHCADEDPSHAFKAGSWDGDDLLLCTSTEVLITRGPRFEVARVVSHPWLNDVHHVARIDGALHVVSTGLDALFVLDDDGAVLREATVLDAPIWARFDRAVDYRKVATTKPHAAHPNYVFRTDEGVWVTRSIPFDAVNVDVPGRRMAVARAPIHDGCARDGSVWFTSVDGHVIQLDARGERVADYDLNEIEGRGVPLGWCRGLHLEGGVLYVGFTRIRNTKLRQNVAWIKRAFQGTPDPNALATRIVAYDLSRARKVGEWDVESSGLNAVFSILPTAGERAPT